MSPVQLWLWGLRHQLMDIELQEDEFDNYGIDDNGPLPNPAWGGDVCIPDAIEVPELHLPISIDEDYHLSQIDPLAQS